MKRWLNFLSHLSSINSVLTLVVLYDSDNYIVVMEAYLFEWNSDKADTNRKKHGVSFEEASTVFYDELARLVPAPDSSMLENRFVLLGLGSQNRLLVVCHCYRGLEKSIRIISARKANSKERRSYEEYNHA